MPRIYMDNTSQTTIMDLESLLPLLDKAIASRRTLTDSSHEISFRLFNGFTEGFPDLQLDIFGRTLVVHNYTDDPTQNQELIQSAVDHLRSSLNWLRAGIIKTRSGKTQQQKNGLLIFGDQPDTRIKEHGIWYAINLTLNRDTSFYLDRKSVV